jgi:two-component system LytT family response regulator
VSQHVMKTLIVDDEPIARQVLREGLELFDDVAVIGEAENGKQALHLIATLHPHLVFLDLQMPVMGGLDVVSHFQSGPVPVVVIVTAFDQHAIQAFEVGAVDYLLKPVSQQRLQKAVERARQLRANPRETAESVAKLADLSEKSAPMRSRKMVGRLGEEFHLLDPSEILAFQAEGEMVWIITAHRKFLATHPLREIELRLQETSFQRIHRNAIVNVDHVRKLSALSSQRWLVTMSNSQEFIVSKRQAQNVGRILSW